MTFTARCGPQARLTAQGGLFLECFRPIRCLLDPPQVLPAGATSCRMGVPPTRNRRLPRHTSRSGLQDLPSFGHAPLPRRRDVMVDKKSTIWPSGSSKRRASLFLKDFPSPGLRPPSPGGRGVKRNRARRLRCQPYQGTKEDALARASDYFRRARHSWRAGSRVLRPVVPKAGLAPIRRGSTPVGLARTPEFTSPSCGLHNCLTVGPYISNNGPWKVRWRQENTDPGMRNNR